MGDKARKIGVRCFGEMDFITHPGGAAFLRKVRLRIVGRPDRLSGWRDFIRLPVLATSHIHSDLRGDFLIKPPCENRCDEAHQALDAL